MTVSFETKELDSGISMLCCCYFEYVSLLKAVFLFINSISINNQTKCLQPLVFRLLKLP